MARRSVGDSSMHGSLLGRDSTSHSIFFHFCVSHGACCMHGAARTWTFFSDSKMFLDSEFEISVMGESDLCAHRHGAGRKRCNLAACKLRRIAPSGGSDRRRSMSWRCCTRRTRRSSSATDCRGDTGQPRIRQVQNGPSVGMGWRESDLSARIRASCSSSCLRRSRISRSVARTSWASASRTGDCTSTSAMHG